MTGRLRYLPQAGSTNQVAKENRDVWDSGTVCYTGCQTGGRGRLGRDWQGAEGEMLALSALLRPMKDAALLPLYMGLAVTRALTALTGGDFAIKWPNDIICKGRKVCGILCESGQDETGGWMVAGVGINLLQGRETFERQGLPYAGSVLELTGKALPLEETAAAVAKAFLSGLKQAPSALLRDYAPLCLTLGREVEAKTPDGQTAAKGVAVGIESDGGLRLAGGTIIRAGEVSVRGYDI